MATAVGTHSGAGPLSLMSCVRESSPHESIPDIETDKTTGSKKKFWKNPRKWFKRKNNKVADDVITVEVQENKETIRSRSTSELSVNEDQPTRRRSGTPLHPGLSVSHDSIFHSPQSGSETELEAAQSSSSLSSHHQPTPVELGFQTELTQRLRIRRFRGDTSEDDEGLPHSPCNSPTVTEGLLDKSAIKDHPTKSHSTCSDGSLLSMGSSDIDEDSLGQPSRHSSKISLHEKKSTDPDSDLELGTNSVTAPLNHSAAHHKVSVRPKRTHGAPRRKRVQQISGSVLPTTPEVNEDSSLRSLTPEVHSKETISELYTNASMSKMTETQLKCSSLPPGLAGPGAAGKLNRSRSNAGSKSQDSFAVLGEEDEDKEEKKDSFFGRFLGRRSGKKKKKETVAVKTTTININSSVLTKVERKPIEKPIEALKPIRSGPASRQRMQPMDIPASPDLNVRISESPLQAELENRFKQKQLPSSTSPVFSLTPIETPPQSPKLTRSPQVDRTHYSKFSKYFEANREESKSKIKIAGLSSLQQRVLSHSDETDDENSFKSLTDLPSDSPVQKPVVKSHSFKSTSTENYNFKDTRYTYVASVTTQESQRSERIENVITVESNVQFADSIENTQPKITAVLDKIKSGSCESLHSVSSTNTTSTEYLDSLNPPTAPNSVTISGPSHKAIVNIAACEESPEIVQNLQEEQISATKIQVKRESQTKSSLPEFFNIQLNKVDAKPSSNVVLTANLTPKMESESKSVFNFDPPDAKRKFSKEDIEIVEKESESNEELVEIPSKSSTASVVITSMTPTNRIYKKYSDTTPQYAQIRKSSIVSISSETKTKLKTKSNSLEIVDGIKKLADSDPEDSKEKTSSVGDLLQTESLENVVLRRKSLVQKKDDEPELMKVFARRSLKLKDNESETISNQVITAVENSVNLDVVDKRDSDKENQNDQEEEEPRKSVTIVKEIPKPKEPLTETTEVTFRKPINNKFFGYQRTLSLNVPKTNDVNSVQKQNSFADRPKTELSEKISNKSWIKAVKNQEPEIKDNRKLDDVISDISPKSDFINEDFPTIPKNFNQRKAEWEKRAQEALKKTVP